VRLIILNFLYCDVASDVGHWHIKRIHLEFLVNHLYIVREDLETTILMTHVVINQANEGVR
jgi:hypothetical protein